jgi:DegV family protein with EDD domain
MHWIRQNELEVKMLRIVTDAAADMPLEWLEKYHISVLPLYIRFGEESYLSDGRSDSATFYRRVLEQRVAPKTSLPSPSQVAAFYRQIAQKGDVIFSLHVASKMSGTFSVVQTAARELGKEFRIYVFDSEAGSAALGLMCREVRRLEALGMTPAKIWEFLEGMRRRLTVVFTLNTLEFAYLSGRVNALQNAMSVILKIKPIVVLRDGLLQMTEKVRTRQHALQRVVAMVAERLQGQLADVVVVHANDLPTAENLLAAVQRTLHVREVMLSELSLPVAANLGPGTIGIVALPVEEGVE